jgi:hypothetical protein
MHIIILHAREVQLIQQRERVLHVHIVVRDAVHDEEAHVLGEVFDVGNGGVVVARFVVLGHVHVAFGVDGIWRTRSAMMRGKGRGRYGMCYRKIASPSQAQRPYRT